MRASLSYTRVFHLLVVCALLKVEATTPYAKHFPYRTARATEKLITLQAYDSNPSAAGDILEPAIYANYVITITKMPPVGKLYQLSYNYVTHGYEVGWKGQEITSVPVDVLAASNHTLIYVAPVNFVNTRFRYTVRTISDSAVSPEGIVDIVAESNDIVMYSNFTFGHESWTLHTATTYNPTYSATSQGCLNHFVYKADEHTDFTMDADNTDRWYFEVPSQYKGSWVNAYNGTMEFCVGAFEGRFTAEYDQPDPKLFVTIECESCNNYLGMNIAPRNVTFRGGTSSFAFQINENPYNGWRLDPHDFRIVDWAVPTREEVVSILSNVSSVKVYADFTTEAESVGFDNFIIKAGDMIETGCYDSALPDIINTYPEDNWPVGGLT